METDKQTGRQTDESIKNKTNNDSSLQKGSTQGVTCPEKTRKKQVGVRGRLIEWLPAWWGGGRGEREGKGWEWKGKKGEGGKEGRWTSLPTMKVDRLILTPPHTHLLPLPSFPSLLLLPCLPPLPSPPPTSVLRPSSPSSSTLQINACETPKEKLWGRLNCLDNIHENSYVN